MKVARSLILRHTSLESSYIPVDLRQKILEEQNYTCYFCGKKKIESLAHELPKCRGGETEVSNLLVCCISCRREKEQLTAEEYLNYKQHILKVEDVFREMIMLIKVYFLDGEVIEGETPTLPKKNNTGLYIQRPGNGEKTWINLKAIKKFEIKGGKQVG